MEALASVWGEAARGGQGRPHGWTPHLVLGLALPAQELCPSLTLWPVGAGRAAAPWRPGAWRKSSAYTLSPSGRAVAAKWFLKKNSSSPG